MDRRFCNRCGVELTSDNWPASFRQAPRYSCSPCRAIAVTETVAKRKAKDPSYSARKMREWRANNREAHLRHQATQRARRKARLTAEAAQTPPEGPDA